MEKRKYSVHEIDQMRSCIRWSYPSNQAYYPQERDAQIEDRLRTYMMNGTDPKELVKMRDDSMRRDQEMNENYQRAIQAHSGKLA